MSRKNYDGDDFAPFNVYKHINTMYYKIPQGHITKGETCYNRLRSVDIFLCLFFHIFLRITYRKL